MRTVHFSERLYRGGGVSGSVCLRVGGGCLPLGESTSHSPLPTPPPFAGGKNTNFYVLWENSKMIKLQSAW